MYLLVLNKNRNHCKVNIIAITQQVPGVYGQVLLLVESYFVHFHNVPAIFFNMVDKVVRKKKVTECETVDGSERGLQRAATTQAGVEQRDETQRGKKPRGLERMSNQKTTSVIL